MSDDDQQDKRDDEKPGGIDLQSGNRRIRIGSDESKTLLGYTGSAWRAVVYAIAFAISFLAICYGVSLIQ
jgi:hypothetical protein